MSISDAADTATDLVADLIAELIEVYCRNCGRPPTLLEIRNAMDAGMSTYGELVDMQV